MATTLHICRPVIPYLSSSTKALSSQLIWGQQRPPLLVVFPSFSGPCVSLNGSHGPLALHVSSVVAEVGALAKYDTEDHVSEQIANEFTCVMKFGGSSVASAVRMREIAELILSFPKERPVIVLSAMGKTTNKLLQAGENAVTCGVPNVSDLEELAFIKDLHLRTVDELGVERSRLLLRRLLLEL